MASMAIVPLWGQGAYWQSSDFSSFRDPGEDLTIILPENFESYLLDINTLRKDLENAPDEKEFFKTHRGVLVTLPMENKLELFEVHQTPIMQPGLAAKYPTIKAYEGYSIKNPANKVRFDMSVFGLRGAIHGPEGIYYIDPYSRIDDTRYIAYDVRNDHSFDDIDVPLCGVEGHDEQIRTYAEHFQLRTDNIPLKEYRIAISCTGEWGSAPGRGTPEKCIADMVSGLNRMNIIFQNELAIRYVLVNDNDKNLYFDKDNDPYNNTADGGSMLGQNTLVINGNIGADSYDLGHVYNLSCNVGGIASLNSMCNFNKGAGVTCHYRNDLNFMATVVTAHEMGHQMGAQHTFNNCNNGGNETNSNGYEPGSGSTIMSYGGLCGSDNVIPVGTGGNYYHVASLIQMYDHIRRGLGADCGTVIETGNFEPEATINLVDNFTIPEKTYFVLEGQGSDMNAEDMLTYCWEEFDIGPLSDLGNPIGTAPHFRSFPPSPIPRRYFPQPKTILSGAFDKNEVLFEGDRTVNFMFTVRDNNEEAGTAVWKKLKFKIKKMEEQFQVTSQNTITSTHVGDLIEVTWNVAGTDLPPINTKEVDIYFHTGSAQNFDFPNMTLLADNIPNTGSYMVNMPNVPTNKGRIIVKAADNIYFDINGRNIQILEPENPAVYFDADPIQQTICVPEMATFNLSTVGFSGIDGDVRFSIADGLPNGATATFDPDVVPVGSDTNLSIDFVNAPLTGTYQITVRAIVENVDTFDRVLTVNLTNTDHHELSPTFPANGESSVSAIPSFEWNPSPNATSYTLQVSKTPDFSSLVYNVENISANTYESIEVLDKNTVYFWRLIPKNKCGLGDPSPISAFSTEALACNTYAVDENTLPLIISQSGKPTVEAYIDVEGVGSIADVNIKTFVGKHKRNKDLVVNLISPAGTEVLLFSKICEQQDFNCKFDDESNTPVKCPLNNGKTYRPKSPLSALNGEDANGTWTLRIDDTKPGNGGQLDGFVMEVCGDLAFSNPFVVNNGGLILPPESIKNLHNAILKVDDDDNNPWELTYTITSLPDVGTLMYNNQPLSIGDHFSQNDINQGSVQYQSPSAEEVMETRFGFIVKDGTGGWTGIHFFNIKIDPISVVRDPLPSDITIYPNPTKGLIFIDAKNTNITKISVKNIQGKIIMSEAGNVDHIDIKGVCPGLYILDIISEKGRTTKKILVE